MSIVIQLDGSALDRLFPEGSEARLNLTANVVNNFVDKLAMKKMGELPAELRAQLDHLLKSARKTHADAIEQVLKDCGFVKSDWHGVSLSDATKRQIKDQAELAMGTMIRDTARELVAEPSVKEQIEHRIGRMMDGDLKQHLENMVNAALKAKFA